MYILFHIYIYIYTHMYVCVYIYIYSIWSFRLSEDRFYTQARIARPRRRRAAGLYSAII